MRTSGPARPSPANPRRVSEALAIATGGSLGASLRYAMALGVTAADQPIVWATASVNCVGAFLLGVVSAHVDSPSAHPLLRPFFVVGVFGSFTTFSALAFDNRKMAVDHGEVLALVHLGASIGCGLLAFVLGATLARRSP